MTARENRFLRRLRAGEQLVGAFATIADPSMVELLGSVGFDWILIDTEHAATDVAGVVDRLRALDGGATDALVRPTWAEQQRVKRLLDAGARTLMFPSIASADDAVRAVGFTRYPPDGVRGVSGITRAARYGQDRGYLHGAADQICVIAQVESASGLDNLEAIAATPGVDVVFIGPSDLAADLGHLGDAQHPEVQAAVDDAFARLHAIGAHAGYLTLDAAEARRRLAEGVDVVGVAADVTIIRRGLASLSSDIGIPLGEEDAR